MISKAIQGFLQYKEAEGLSPRTIVFYSHDVRVWLEYQKDMDVAEVTTIQLRAYFTDLNTSYKPNRFDPHNKQGLSLKTIHDHWISLCAFFHWASDEFKISNPMKGVPVLKFQEPEVVAFTKGEIDALLKACDFCMEA